MSASRYLDRGEGRGTSSSDELNGPTLRLGFTGTPDPSLLQCVLEGIHRHLIIIFQVAVRVVTIICCGSAIVEVLVEIPRPGF